MSDSHSSNAAGADDAAAAPVGFRVRRWLFQRWFRATRCLTLGVRVLVRDEAGRVLLVRHTYMPGWALPGGGVEKLESAEQTVRHELLDEAGIRVLQRPRLFGIYANHAWFPNDHVLLYLLAPGDYAQEPWRPGREIAEKGFFAPDSLPAETTAGTRRRLREVLEGLPPAECW